MADFSASGFQEEERRAANESTGFGMVPSPID
jgi:hypothetical protein